MRITQRVSLALVVVMSSLLVLQPLSVGAADCSKEQAAVDALVKEMAVLQDQLHGALDKLASAQADMASDLQKMNAVQATLAAEGPKVQDEINQSNGVRNALLALGLQFALSFAIDFTGPEGLALVGEQITLMLEGIEQVHTMGEVFSLFGEASDVEGALDALSARLGSQDQLLAFANQNGLTELAYMINQEMYFATLTHDFKQAYSRWADAADAVVAYQALIDLKQKQLDAAMAALAACRDQPAPMPSPNPCQPAAPPADGGIHAGVCR